jgi:hypothetical protein
MKPFTQFLITLLPITEKYIKTNKKAGCLWLMLIVLVTQEAEIRRIMVQSQPRELVRETLSRKTLHKNRAGGVAQGEGTEFKPQYCKQTTNKKPCGQRDKGTSINHIINLIIF